MMMTPVKLPEWQLTALMGAGIVLIGAGLVWVHPGLFVVAVGAIMFVLSCEIETEDDEEKK